MVKSKTQKMIYPSWPESRRPGVRWERHKNRASRPSQGTINGGAISEWPRCRWDVTHNQPTSPESSTANMQETCMCTCMNKCPKSMLCHGEQKYKCNVQRYKNLFQVLTFPYRAITGISMQTFAWNQYANNVDMIKLVLLLCYVNILLEHGVNQYHLVNVWCIVSLTSGGGDVSPVCGCLCFIGPIVCVIFKKKGSHHGADFTLFSSNWIRLSHKRVCHGHVNLRAATESLSLWNS